MNITRKIGPPTKYKDQLMGLHPFAKWFHPCALYGSPPAQVLSPYAKRQSHPTWGYIEELTTVKYPINKLIDPFPTDAEPLLLSHYFLYLNNNILVTSKKKLQMPTLQNSSSNLIYLLTVISWPAPFVGSAYR